MPLQDIQNEIESPLFSAELGVVSTPRSFDQALFKHPAFRRLLEALANDPAIDAVLHRTMGLLDVPSDPNYSHPWDLPIAAYLRALDLRAGEKAYEVSTHVAAKPNVWWARAMAMRALAEPNRKAATSTTQGPLAQVTPATAQSAPAKLSVVSWNEPPRELRATGTKRPAKRALGSKGKSSDTGFPWLLINDLVIERYSKAA